MTKLNYREIIRRAFKYIIIIATVYLACITVTNKLNNTEIIWIAIIRINLLFNGYYDAIYKINN